MIQTKPPRDWLPTLGGLSAACLLAAWLGWAFWGPALRIARTGFNEVWVTIIPPPGSPPRPGLGKP